MACTRDTFYKTDRAYQMSAYVERQVNHDRVKLLKGQISRHALVAKGRVLNQAAAVIRAPV